MLHFLGSPKFFQVEGTFFNIARSELMHSIFPIGLQHKTVSKHNSLHPNNPEVFGAAGPMLPSAWRNPLKRLLQKVCQSQSRMRENSPAPRWVVRPVAGREANNAAIWPVFNLALDEGVWPTENHVFPQLLWCKAQGERASDGGVTSSQICPCIQQTQVFMERLDSQDAPEPCFMSKMTSNTGIDKDGEGAFLHADRDLKHEPEGPDHKDLLVVIQSCVSWWQRIQDRDQLHQGFLSACSFFPHPLIL